MTSASRILCALVAGSLAIVPIKAADKKPPFFQYQGQVLDADGKLIRNPEPLVFLHGGTLPYNNSSRVGFDGKFKFEKLLQGSYLLIVAVGGQGEMRQTIEIGPTLANKKGAIREVIKFKPVASPDGFDVVHKSQLAIPSQAHDELQRGLQSLGKNDVESAKKHVRLALDVAPHYAEAWNELGVISYQTGDYPAAEQHFRQALEEDPAAYWALVNLGGALLALGKDHEALEINLRAVKRAPEDALAHSQLGKSYFQLREYEKAETHLRQAVALDPRHFSAPQVALADLYFLQRRYEERIRELEEYLKYHPDGYFAARVRTLLKEARQDKGDR